MAKATVRCACGARVHLAGEAATEQGGTGAWSGACPSCHRILEADVPGAGSARIVGVEEPVKTVYADD